MGRNFDILPLDGMGRDFDILSHPVWDSHITGSEKSKIFFLKFFDFFLINTRVQVGLKVVKHSFNPLCLFFSVLTAENRKCVYISHKDFSLNSLKGMPGYSF